MIDEEDPVPPWWARLLGLDFHSDDPDILQRHFYDRQTNVSEGYICNEVVLSFTKHSWGFGVEAEYTDLSGYRREAWWRGVTLRFGPFSLTASRQKGSL